MADVMTFPERLEDFLKSYSFRDEKEVYTNGAELIPLLRVRQAIGHYCKPIVRAHWRTLESGADCVCSNCRRYWIPKDDKYDFMFCPNCGAIMDEDGGAD